MDIQSASNFERLYFETGNRNAVETARAFEAFGVQRAFDIPPTSLAAMRGLFASATASEAETARTILATLNETGVLVDPHTAVGLAAAAEVGPARPGAPVATLATAHPAKFPEAVAAAAGVTPSVPASILRLGGRPEYQEPIAADAEAVKSFVRQFAGAGA